LAKLPTVKAIKDFVVASIKFLKTFREWDENWQYSPNDPCFRNGVGYTASPDNVPLKGEKPEDYPLKWNVIGSTDSGATSIPTPNRVTKFDLTARLRSGKGAVDPDHVVRKRELNLRASTYQVYGEESLLLSNARQVLRRQRGWDLGVPYLSQNGEIYHFDTDLLNQNQQSNISIDFGGFDAPTLVGKDDFLSDDNPPFDPAVINVPPHEVISKSLYGNFKITKTIPASEKSTFDFWVKFFDVENHTVFRIGTSTDSVILALGLGDPEYSVLTSENGDPVYSVPESDNIRYSVRETLGDVLTHQITNGGTNIVPLNMDVSMEKWFHIAVVNTKTLFSVYINDTRFDFTKSSTANQQVTAVFNESYDVFNIDELYIDGSSSLDFSAFTANTLNKIPYAALNYHEKWFVLEAEDFTKVKTNLFETQAFKTAVQAVINNT